MCLMGTLINWALAFFFLKQRSSGELASYQKKLIKIDEHMGIAIAGLTSDARVLRYFTFLQQSKNI